MNAPKHQKVTIFYVSYANIFAHKVKNKYAPESNIESKPSRNNKRLRTKEYLDFFLLWYNNKTCPLTMQKVQEYSLKLEKRIHQEDNTNYPKID